MESGESRTIAILAEKPSVAQDIARVLGANTRGKGYLQGNGYVVTWAIGHLVSLAQPHEIKPEWRQWRFDHLPILPTEWPLVVYERTKDQFEVVRKILTSSRVSRIVCATDAGREGELIFRYIYEAAGCRKPVSRLWISSLTPDAIRTGFERARPSAGGFPLFGSLALTGTAEELDRDLPATLVNFVGAHLGLKNTLDRVKEENGRSCQSSAGRSPDKSQDEKTRSESGSWETR
jgi:hypothetical protein